MIYGLGGGPASVAIADLDADGDNDLAVANFTSDNVSVLKNNGNGTFAAHVTYAAGSLPDSVAIADLDADGDMDLAVANANSNNVSVLKNNGDGTFSAHVPYGVGSSPRSVAIADLDGNTSPDLAVANYSGNNVSILINLTEVLPPGAFSLTLPADGAGGLPLPDDVIAGWAVQPSLRWSRPNSFAEPTYDLTVATDAGLTNIVVQQNGLTQRQFDLLYGVLQFGAAYYWSVTAHNSIGSRVSTPSPARFSISGVCPGDANNDRVVNFADLTAVLSRFLDVCP
ncbi:MAG: VCBS repeat-containing protein [Phycisphaerae bacterium]|nr:VCBS repeat-containing protein [Phycisphaerae bacterium]